MPRAAGLGPRARCSGPRACSVERGPKGLGAQARPNLGRRADALSWPRPQGPGPCAHRPRPQTTRVRCLPRRAHGLRRM
eukprot:2867704-Pyramimonas_sp.AAC.1